MDLERSRVPPKPWFSQKKVGVFSILWNHCNGASDLQFEFYTEDMVKEKRCDALDYQKKLFLTVFEPFEVPSPAAFCGHMAFLWSCRDRNGTKIGPFWGDFGPFFGRSGVILGSLRDHFGIVLASCWARFGLVLTPFWAALDHFGPFLGTFFCPLSRHFWGIFAPFSVF